MARFTTLIVLIAGAVAAAGAAASEIYRFVDSEGNVHFVDRPSGVPSEERLDVISSRTDNAAVRANVQARLDRQAERQAERTRAQEDAKAAADDAAAAARREQQCTEYRERMETYLRSTRLYRENEAGEREYLDESQMMEARDNLQAKIQETCS